MTGITTRTVAVYQANGKGRMWRLKAAAYRAASIERVNEACMEQHPGVPSYHDVTEPCRYCDRTCAGLRGARHTSPASDDEGCGVDPEHSYRYRLVGRLARWLKWRDGRAGS